VREADLLPDEQHAYAGLPELPPREIHRRREGMFLIFAGAAGTGSLGI